MSYYTEYSLEVIVPKSVDHIKNIRNSIADADMSINSAGDTEGEAKWYNHEEDIKTYSKIYPEVLFILSGVGEELGDLWKKYFKGGKMQYEPAKIKFAPFDEAKLSE